MILGELPNSVHEPAVDQSDDHGDEAASFNRRALFVGGCPKSGTTLLLSLLDGHPELAVLPVETHYLEEVRRYAAREDNLSTKLKRLLQRLDPEALDSARRKSPPEDRELGAHYHAGFDYLRFARLAETFAARPGMNDSLLLSETVRAYMEVSGDQWRSCARWVEKTPSNVAHAGELFRLFPDAKLIHVVRDPRAVFASRRQRLLKRYGSHTKAHRLVREWNESVRQIWRLRGRRGSHLVVRYEDLVKQSRSVMKRICEFAGIEYRPVLLEPTLSGKAWPGNATFSGTFDGIDRKPADQWRTELTPDEVWWVELHCSRGMAIAGYELQSDARFSFWRWARRVRGESWRGYLRARKSSLCHLAGLLEECRYDQPDVVGPPPMERIGDEMTSL